MAGSLTGIRKRKRGRTLMELHMALSRFGLETALLTHLGPTRINVHDPIRILCIYTVRRFSSCHHCGYVHLGHYQPTRRPSRLAVSSRHVPNGTYPGLVRDIFPSQIRTITSRWREIHDQDETPAPSGNARLGGTPGNTHFWFRIATWTYICFALGSRFRPNRGFGS